MDNSFVVKTTMFSTRKAVNIGCSEAPWSASVSIMEWTLDNIADHLKMCPHKLSRHHLYGVNKSNVLISLHLHLKGQAETH